MQYRPLVAPAIIRTKRARVVAAPAHPLPPLPAQANLLPSQRAWRKARAHTVYRGGIQASHSFTNGTSAERTKQNTAKPKKLNQNHGGGGSDGRDANADGPLRGGLLLLLQRRLLLLLLLLLLARHTAFHACGCRTLQILPPNVTIYQ